jgi:hypothetical protein
MLAGEYGIAHKLPCGTASVLLTSASPLVGDTVTIDVGGANETIYTFVNAFTGALNQIMHPSITTHPRMFDAGVCMLRLMRAINASGREGVEYSEGQQEHPTVVATSINAQTNTQIAKLKVETKGLTALDVAESTAGVRMTWSNATTSTQATVTAATNTYMPGHYVHPFNINFGFPRPDTAAGVVGATLESKGKLLNSTEAILARWDAQGKCVWVLTSRLATVTPAGTLPATDQKFGGIGFACQWGVDGDAIYSVGDQYTTSPTGTSEQAWVRRILDSTTGYDISSAGAWSVGSMTMIGTVANTHANYPGGHCKIDVDKFDNVYVPYDSPPFTDGAASLVVLDKDGAVAWTFRVANAATNPSGVCVSVDKKQPEYDGDATTRGFACYLGTRMGTDTDLLTQDNIYRIEPVSVTHATGVPSSETRLCAVVDGELWTSLSGGAFTEPAGLDSLANPILAQDADNPDGFVSMVALNGHLFGTDGITYFDYDGRKDSVVLMRCKTAGELKQRARGVAAWRGRLIWFRFADDPYEFLMSAVGNQYDYDIARQPSVRTQATLGSKSPRGTGQAPDIINAIIPFTDDTSIWLCQSSVWRLDGDPMDSGRFTIMSDSTGGAFGESWCKDENGTIYFFGTRGSVFAIHGNGAIVPISEDAIPERLRVIDLGSTRPRLVWDNEEQGFHLFLTDVDPASATVSEHYFWSRRTKGWYPDSFKSVDHQPTSVFVGDGDLAANRTAVIGCVDGYVRQFDSSATEDDGEPILSRALIGPLAPEDIESDVRFKGLVGTLATARGGCAYQMFASQAPDDLGAAVASGDLDPGRNGKDFGANGYGKFVALEVSAVSRDGFSVESLEIDAYPACRSKAT